MNEAYVTKTFSATSQELIDLANGILAEYQANNFDLTIRQLYYQLVSRGYIQNNIRSYKRIVSLIGNARLAGLVDWNMITDRGRNTVANQHWTSPAQIIQSAAYSFRIDKWEKQKNYVECFCEKDALSGVLEPVCSEMDIPFTANKGYSSLSLMHQTGKRLARKSAEGKTVYILYFGDHDPSGIDMTKDVRKRLELFSDIEVKVARLALNFDQVEQLHPPENPAKEADSRFRAYFQRFGSSSWELDAVEPRALANMVRDAVKRLRDQKQWDIDVAREQNMRNYLLAYANQYSQYK